MKPNLLDQLYLAFSPEKGLSRIRARAAAEMMRVVAGYDGAGKGPGSNWVRGSGTSQNAESRTALVTLRNRHRELVRNNPYVTSAVDATESLLVADGISPVAKNPDPKKQKLANELMLEWARSTFVDKDGLMDLPGLQSLVSRSETESGETIVMRSISRSKKVRVPLQLRVLESDYLDHLRDGEIDGRRVVQGVAFDKDGSRSGYYIHDHHPGDNSAFSKTSKSKFIDASEIAHVYWVGRPGQARGIPRGASVMNRVRNLDEFQDARLHSQKLAACMATFITQNEDTDKPLKADPLPDKLHPGMVGRLAAGELVSHTNPPSVTGQEAFVIAEEQLIAKGYGLNRQIITGDISSANFASTKIGRLEVYAFIRKLRKHMLVPQLLNQVGEWFVEAAELVGHDISGTHFEWVPPRQEILNLKDDIPALIRQCRGGLGSISMVLRSLGFPDPVAVLKEIAEDNKLLDELGIILDSDPRNTTQNGQRQSVADQDTLQSKSDSDE